MNASALTMPEQNTAERVDGIVTDIFLRSEINSKQ